MSAMAAARIAAYGALGASIGMAYFVALAWNVRLYTGRTPGWSAPILHLARVSAAAAAFTLCARYGGALILASFGGFFAIRVFSVNRYRPAAWRNS